MSEAVRKLAMKLKPCQYYRHNLCCKPFFTGNMRWYGCPDNRKCCVLCAVEFCPIKCVEVRE